jgi:hypothetical protein
MRRLGRVIARAVLLAGLMCGSAARAEDIKPALAAKTEFLDHSGQPVTRVRPEQPVVIRVTIASSLSDEAPAGLSLFGWLRRMNSSDLPCGEAAEAFLRTGRLPTGTIFLNDPVIGTLTEDNAFIVSDPEFSLATANILGATTFSSRPSALVTDAERRRFLFALPDEGRVVAFGTAGQEETVLEALEAPRDVAATPGVGVMVLEAGGRLLFGGEKGGVTEIADAVAAIRPTSDPRWLVAISPDQGLLIDTVTRRITQSLDQPGLTDTAALMSDGEGSPFALATLARTEVAIRYLDDPGAPVEIALPNAATRLAAAPGGRVLLAWSPDGGPVHVIDVARGRLVRSVGANAAISEIAFSDRSAFLMLESQTHVGALDLAAIARGDTAEFREIQIGTASDAPAGDRRLLAPLWPMEGMLAVHADSYQGYRIMDGSTMGDAPAMTATALRGGVPRMVATLDRSFRERPRGVFTTVASLPGSGRYEFVAATGLGALNFCAEVPVAEPDGPAGAQPGKLLALRDGHAVRLRVIDSAGRPLPDLSGTLTFAALVGGWRANAPITTDATGLSEATYALPDIGEIFVRLEAQGRDAFSPLLLEDTE